MILILSNSGDQSIGKRLENTCFQGVFRKHTLAPWLRHSYLETYQSGQ